MYKLASLGIFATAFLMTANMQIYIHSLRLGIYSWHVFVPVIPLQILIALVLGNWLRLDVGTRLFAAWWFALLIVVGASLLFTSNDQASIYLATQYTTVALMSVSFLAVAQRPNLIKASMYGVATAVAAASGISLAEFINPEFNMVIDQRYESRTLEDAVQRVGGLHINPNQNSRIMALGMFVSAFFLPQKYRLVFCLFIGLGVFTTISRSGISTWALAFVMLFALGQFAPGKIVVKAVGFLSVLAMAIALSTGKIPILLEATGIDEYMDQRMIARLSTSFFTQEDDSTSGRRELAKFAVEMYADNAFSGAGLGGSARLGGMQLGSHNTMLEIAAELGSGGLLVFLCLFLIPLYFRSPKAICFTVLFFYSCMFAHGQLTKPTLAFILPAGVVLLGVLDQTLRSQRKRVRKKRGRRRRSNSSKYVAKQA